MHNSCMTAPTPTFPRPNLRAIGDSEAERLAALARPQGTRIEVALGPELISTRGTLAALMQASRSALLG